MRTSSVPERPKYSARTLKPIGGRFSVVRGRIQALHRPGNVSYFSQSVNNDGG